MLASFQEQPASRTRDAVLPIPVASTVGLPRTECSSTRTEWLVVRTGCEVFSGRRAVGLQRDLDTIVENQRGNPSEFLIRRQFDMTVSPLTPGTTRFAKTRDEKF